MLTDALATLANVPSGSRLWQARGEPVRVYSCFGSTIPFPLPPHPSLPKTPPLFTWPCGGSAKRRGQSGKGARCAPLSFLRLPVSVIIYVATQMIKATEGTQKVRGSGLVRGAVAPHTRP